MRTEIRSYNPAEAKHILDHFNTQNRKIRSSWVKCMAEAMRRGEWKLTHQGLAFDVDGILQDGQHRLAAVCESGVTVSFMVTLDMPKDNFSALDVHAKRSYGDLTGLDKRESEICTLLARQVYNSNNITPGQILDMAKSGVLHRHQLIIDLCPTTAAVFSSAPCRAMASVMMLSGEYDSSYIMQSYRRLVLHKIEEMSKIEQKFFKRVYENRGIKTGGSNSAILEKMAICKKCFDPEYADHSKLYATERDMQNVVTYVKKVVETAIEISGGTA
jgi:hypothetical protein